MVYVLILTLAVDQDMDYKLKIQCNNARGRVQQHVELINVQLQMNVTHHLVNVLFLCKMLAANDVFQSTIQQHNE